MDFWIRVKTSFDGKGFNEAKAKLGGFLKQGLVAGGKVAVASLAAVGSAAVATTVKAVDFADETNAAMETFAQSTGVATDKLNAYKDVALDVFSGQFGESVEDVAETMALIERNTGAGAEEIGGLTEKALLLRDTFGKDVEETLRTVDSLIKNGVARNADEAFDIIVAGMQQGADKAGAYGLQGAAALFADDIEGSVTNVIGLPLPLLDRLCTEAGVDLLSFRSRT